MTAQQIFLLLRARYRVILFTLLGMIGAAVAITFILPKKYTATTMLVIDHKEPITDVELPKQLSPTYMQTQLDILNSRSVALQVVDDHNLILLVPEEERPLVTRASLADRLLKNLKVTPSQESRVVKLAFTSTDPSLAADLANGFARAYRSVTLELNVSSAQRNATWFSKQLEDLRKWLEEAQRKLASYQQKKGILSTHRRLDIETSRLEELARQIVTAQINASEAESRVKELDNMITNGVPVETLSEVRSNDAIQQLQTELLQQESLLAELSTTLGENHPQFKHTDANVKGLREKIAKEIQEIVKSFHGNATRLRTHANKLQEEFEMHRTKLLDLKQSLDQIPALEREVEDAERAYQLALQRFSDNTLESRIDEANVTILHEAVVPGRHSSPSLQKNLFVSAFLGTFLGIGLVVLAEMLNPRIRGERDIVEQVKVPLLGVLE